MSDKINLSYDASSNLMLAYDTMRHLHNLATGAGLKCTAIICNDHDGELFFSIDGAQPSTYFLRDINTEEASIFKQKNDQFLADWEMQIADGKAVVAARIAELKAELAKLEGK